MGFGIGGFRPSFNVFGGGGGLGGLAGSALGGLAGGGLGALGGLAGLGQGGGDLMSVMGQLSQAFGVGGKDGAMALAGGKADPQQVENLLKQLRDLVQKDPAAFMQALQKFPELAQVLAELLGMGGSAQKAPAAAGHAGGGHAAGGGGGGSKGGIKMDGPGGFLWKPVSDSDGRLAILTPERFTGRVSEVVIRDAAGNVLEKGRPAGVGNGGREHFRFSKPGGAYPPGVTVEVRLAGGQTEKYPIADTSQRYD